MIYKYLIFPLSIMEGEIGLTKNVSLEIIYISFQEGQNNVPTYHTGRWGKWSY